MNIVLACSIKEQVNISFSSEMNGMSITHKEYVLLGQSLFINQNISQHLHAYNVTIDHKFGEIILDKDEKESIESIMEDVKSLLQIHGFKILRVSLEKPTYSY